MAYWIHENGKTIGPFRAIEILQKAKPETLVSHGQEWLELGEHPDFRSLNGVNDVSGVPATARDDLNPGTSARRKTDRNLRLPLIAIAAVSLLFLLVLTIGIVGSYGTASSSSASLGGDHGPGPCGENWDHAIQAAVNVREYLKSTAGQPLDLNSYPKKSMGLVNTLILDPSIDRLPTDQRAACAALALQVGQILAETNGTIYLERGRQLGNDYCAIALSQYYFGIQGYQNAYRYAYLSQKVDMQFAEAMMSATRMMLTPYEYQEIRQYCENYY